MTFTNLKKYVYSKKCLNQRRQHPPQPTPPFSKVEGVFVRKKSPGYSCYLQENMPLGTRALLRFQNTISCCHLSSGVSYNTPILFFKFAASVVCYTERCVTTLKNGCVADYRKSDKKRKKSLTEFSADRGV